MCMYMHFCIVSMFTPSSSSSSSSSQPSSTQRRLSHDLEFVSPYKKHTIPFRDFESNVHDDDEPIHYLQIDSNDEGKISLQTPVQTPTNRGKMKGGMMSVKIENEQQLLQQQQQEAVFDEHVDALLAASNLIGRSSSSSTSPTKVFSNTPLKLPMMFHHHHQASPSHTSSSSSSTNISPTSTSTKSNMIQVKAMSKDTSPVNKQQQLQQQYIQSQLDMQYTGNEQGQ